MSELKLRPLMTAELGRTRSAQAGVPFDSAQDKPVLLASGSRWALRQSSGQALSASGKRAPRRRIRGPDRCEKGKAASVCLHGPYLACECCRTS